MDLIQETFMYYSVQTGSEVHPAFYPAGARDTFPEDKAVGDRS
jgi:hypothetical protein